MTKCLSCLTCGAVKSFNADGSTTTCECSPALVYGWWHDQQSGFVRVHVSDPERRDQAQVVLLHNGVLRAWHDTLPYTLSAPDGSPRVFTQQEADTAWQHIHREALNSPNLPQYLTVFHSSHRGCWAVVQRPGDSPDTLWADPDEALARGLPVLTATV